MCECTNITRIKGEDITYLQCNECGIQYDMESIHSLLGVSPRPPHKCHPEDMIRIKGMIYTCLKCSVCGQEYDIESTHPRVVSTPYPMGKVD